MYTSFILFYETLQSLFKVTFTVKELNSKT